MDMTRARYDPIQDNDVETVSGMLMQIHRTASRLFVEGWQEGKAGGWIFRGTHNPHGVFCIIRKAKFVVCYAAFDSDPDAPEILSAIGEFVNRALIERGERALFCNVRGANAALIAQLRSRGFREDTLGYEMVCRVKPETQLIPERLMRRGYEKEHFNAYVELLDSAFNPLIRQAGGPPDAFRREGEDLETRLDSKAEKEEFAAFWQGSELAGLYYLTEDLIEVLAVNPAFQNRGYGGILLQHATHHLLSEAGYPAAYLMVVATNKDARRLYERQGYVVSGFYSENTYIGINV
jgi:GNAT superfamily N-acetyltransferase